MWSLVVQAAILSIANAQDHFHAAAGCGVKAPISTKTVEKGVFVPCSFTEHGTAVTSGILVLVKSYLD